MNAYDLLVVGGGVNGAGIARDAAGRGLSVLLCEQDDLAAATSSASSKLIHGGLRYLEQYEFRLVREALAEREVLLRTAPHLIRPMRFVLPHDETSRPRWLIRLGLFLYDHLGGRRSLPGTETIKCRAHPYGAPLKATVADAFAYSDCAVDDARLVVLAARAAADLGAEIATRTRLTTARRDGGGWIANLRDMPTGADRVVRARALVNAAGPWVADVIGRTATTSSRRLRLVKGSHIVVPRLYDGEQAYILQNHDRRIVFVIPWQDRFTLIGTTDVPFEGDPARVAISAEEIGYLCDAASRWLARPVTPDQVVSSFAGVRPLYDDRAASAATVTRDYVLDLDAPDDRAPLLSVFGGKITTFRRLAEHALDKLQPFFPQARPAWTRTAVLPGGDIPADFAAALQRYYPGLPVALVERLARAYGSAALEILGEARSQADLGIDFGATLSQREVDWLVAHEWAREVDDVLWRRTKLGLVMSEAGVRHLRGYLVTKLAWPTAPAFVRRRSTG